MSLSVVTDYSVVSLSVIIISLLIYKIWRKQPTQCGFPAGPFSWPVLGSLPYILLAGSTNQFLKACRKKFGNIFTIEIGGSKRVVVCGYDNLHNLLVKNADFTSNRTLDSFPEELQEIIKERPGLIWAPYPEWKTMRSFALNVMRDEGMGKSSMEPQIIDEAERFCCNYIEPHLGEPVELSMGLRKATCNVISELIFGGRSSYDDPAMDRLIHIMDEAFKVTLQRNLTKNIPILNRINFITGLNKSRKISEVMIPEMVARLNKHKEDFDAENTRDIFDEFILHQQKTSGSTGLFSDMNASTAAMHLFSAGTETTSTALSWSLLFTCLHPEVKDKVQAEIESVIGQDRHASYADRNKMPYTEAVLLETLRLANIAPSALPHVLDKDLVLDGTLIPAGAELMASLVSVLHDEEVFDNPMQFKPDRYLSGDTAMKKLRTVAFSMGRRVCLGESLARMEFFMFYVTFLQKYDVEFPSGVVPSTKLVEGLTNSPQPYHLVFSRREAS